MHTALWNAWQSLSLRGVCSNLLHLKGSTKLLLTSKAVGLSPRLEISFNINWIKRGGFPSKNCHFLGHGMRFVLNTIITRANTGKQVPNSVARHPKIQWRRTSMYRNSRCSLICLNTTLLTDRTRAEAPEKHHGFWSWERRQDLSSH